MRNNPKVYSGTTALFEYVFNRTPDIALLHLLLAHGADPNISDFERQTPLHIACQTQQTQVVAVLVNHMSLRVLDKLDSKQHTPLIKAVLGGSTEIALMLLKHGANPNIGTVTDPNGSKGTLLHLAAATGNLVVIEALLKHGANHLSLDSGGKRAQSIAEEHRHPEAAQILAAFARRARS